MDVNKTTQLRLYRNNLTPIKPDDRYSNSFVTVEEYQNNIIELKKVIKFLHNDLTWDGIPTIEEVKERLIFGSVCMLWKFENEVIGWSWLNNDHISIDWKSKYSTLKKNTEQYGGGAFLSKQNKPEPGAGYKFFRYGIENMLKYYNKEVLYLYNDDWNRASSILSRKCGFKEHKFL